MRRILCAAAVAAGLAWGVGGATSAEAAIYGPLGYPSGCYVPFEDANYNLHYLNQCALWWW